MMMKETKLIAGSIAGFVFLCLLGSLYFLMGLKTEYAVDQFYPKEHSLLKNHDQIKNQFRLNEKSPYLFVIELKGKEPWLRPENIARLKDLTKAIMGRSDISQVMSLTQVEGATQTDNELVIGNIFDREKPANWKKAALGNSLIYPLLINSDFSSTLLAIEPRVRSQNELIKLERELDSSMKEAFPQGTLSTAGVPLLQTRLSKLIHSELKLFLFFISLAFCGVFYFLFSHWSAILCAFSCLLASNIFALALMSLFKINMNAILVTMPVIISVLVMSLLIHTLHLWSSRKNSEAHFETNWLRAIETLKELCLPNALGIITTALGFMALSPSPIPLISQYGWTVAIILGFVAILNQLMLALILPFVTPRMRPWFDRPAYWSLWSIRNPKKILTSIFFVTVFGIIMISRLNFSARLFDDLPKNDSVRAATKRIDKSFGGILSYEVSALSVEEGFWKKAENLNKLNSLAMELRKTKGVGTVVTVSDFFQGNIPKTSQEIAETLFLFSMAEKNPMNSFMSDDGKVLRLGIRLSDIPNIRLNRVKLAILAICQKSFPEIKFKEGGLATYAHAINQEVARALIMDFWQPLLFIGIFLVFMFRSFKWAILSCLPNFIPPAFLIGALAITQAPVKPGIALIFSISLGFAFNNTLYILSRLRSLSSKKKANPLRDALLMEANPCLFESVVMLVGFSFFLFSEFNMNQIFGGFMLISIIAGFIADLLFLPAFLKMFPSIYIKKLVPIPVASTAKYKNVAAALVVFLGLSTLQAATPSAKEILQKSQVLLDAKDDQATVEMKIIEANGETKSRTLELKTIRENGFSVLARIQTPADIKGMAFLGNVDKDGNEMQWIYLPSSGQVRRLVTGKSKAGLLGSEINPEDLNSQAVKTAEVKLVKSDSQFYWIELVPKKDTSAYNKVLTKISVKDYLPMESDYYVSDKLTKTVAFSDYKKIGPVWRAQLMTVKNLSNNRGTEVKLTNLKVNSGLKADDFSQSSLKEE
jgi:uncharacterized protein